MNRTIKFRGKRIDNGQWVYGFLAEDYYINDVNSVDFPSIEIASETVGQFTGLLDKNDNEIYEGDILCYIDDSGHIHTWEVVCEIACMKLRREKGAIGRIPNTPMFNHDTRKMHIIGNVYDHPEQLKTEI